MDVQLYSIMRRDQHGLIAVGDGFSLLALVAVPIWAIWHGLWITFCGILVVVVIAALISPFAVSPAMFGLGLIGAFEGGAVRRAELDARDGRRERLQVGPLFDLSLSAPHHQQCGGRHAEPY